MTGPPDAVVVRWSTPQACDVCHAREAIAWQWAGARHLAHRAPCPHCWLGLPAVYLRRWRTDIPSTGGAA